MLEELEVIGVSFEMIEQPEDMASKRLQLATKGLLKNKNVSANYTVI